MRKVVADNWIPFNADLEGIVYHMYPDDHRDKDGNADPIVTTGMGNALLNPSDAVGLPWVHQGTGRMASGEEIIVAWWRVKRATTISRLGGNSDSARALSDLRLKPADVEALIRWRLCQNVPLLRKRFEDLWDDLCADAQMGIMSMCWAMGEAKLDRFPRFCAAIRDGDFVAAADECEMGPKRGTIITRNARNRACFLAAARVVAEGLDADVLHFLDEGPAAA